MTSYIGVTGFMHWHELGAALVSLPESCPRSLMVGVLASSKTLAGATNKYPNRYPAVGNIEGIFAKLPRTLNLIHYATDERETLARQLEQLIGLAGPSLNGFQLNVSWPEPATFEILRGKTVVLQLNGRATAELTPEQVAAKLDPYAGLVTDVLVDLSGGRGLPFDPKRAAELLQAIDERHPTMGLGVAGGLSVETMGLVVDLAERFPRLSVDAEGRLRDEQDDLDSDRVGDYVRAAARLFKRVR